MSIKMIQRVWDSQMPDSEMVVMQAMADYADDNGESIYPSIARLCWKLSISRRTLQRRVKVLTDKDYLKLVGQHPTYKTNEYKILIDNLVPKISFDEWTIITDGGVNLTRVSDGVEGGVKSGKGGVTAMTPDPLVVDPLVVDPLDNTSAAAQPPADPDFGKKQSELAKAYYDAHKLWHPDNKMEFKPILGQMKKHVNKVTPQEISDTYLSMKEDEFWRHKLIKIPTVIKNIGIIQVVVESKRRGPPRPTTKQPATAKKEKSASMLELEEYTRNLHEKLERANS